MFFMLKRIIATISFCFLIALPISEASSISPVGYQEFSETLFKNLRANNVEVSEMTDMPNKSEYGFIRHYFNLDPAGEGYSVLHFSLDSEDGYIEVVSIGLDYNNRVARRNGTVTVITVLRLMGLSDNEIEKLMAPGKNKTSVRCKATGQKVYLEGSVDKRDPIVYMTIYCD